MPLAFPWPCLPPAGYLKIFFVGEGVQLEKCFKELSGLFGGTWGVKKREWLWVSSGTCESPRAPQ